MQRSRLLPLMAWLLTALMLVGLPTQAQEGPPADGPAYSTLADLLENEASRSQLIGQLRDLAANGQAAAASTVDSATSSAAEAAPSGQQADAASLPRQLAELTSTIASQIGSQLEGLASALGGLFKGTGPGQAFDMAAFTSAALNLGLVIAATIALFFVFRRLARPAFDATSRWSLSGQGMTPVLRLVVAVAIAAVIDVLVVALAYVGGNLLATFAIGESGELSTRASLFLNAFLIIELLKAGVRMLFASRYEGLRLLPITATEASYWNRWLARLIGLVGYGLMVVVPLLNYYLSPALGQGMGTLIMLGAFVYAVGVVLKNRQRLRDGLDAQAAKASMAATRVSLKLFARIWHLLAIAYFLMVLVLTFTRPEDALPFVMLATLQTLAVVGAGMLLSRLLTQTIGRRIHLSEDLKRKLPLLETRLNAYVPNLLRVIRALILIVVVMITAGAWGLFDLGGWYATDLGRGLVAKVISVLVIVTMAMALWVGLASLIEHRLNPETGDGEPTARAQTLLSLFRNALAITIIAMTVMVVLSEIGINIGPLIAGAGVLGLAIGFGAQKLVQDIITGVFIQVENAMNTGDVVTVGGVTGTAERLSIRSVGIRDLSGTYHIVPFSSVDTVSNYMREFAYHVGEYGIAYRESIDEAIECLKEAFEELAASDDHKQNLLAPLEVAGVVALADSSVNIRVRLKTTPGTQWATGRAYNRLVKMHFDAAGIEIPFPHTTLYFGEDKDGSAPAGNVRVLEGRASQRATQTQDASADDAEPLKSDERSIPAVDYRGENDET
ncbi:mechanosensitive channel protein [Halomonas sp. YLGW01]|uniref:mechanosensitive channel protein n=1 Tax=Halomonas sp. YLGW01 TaxID=2773308 RepID=UPI00192DEF82|nr:mechanosensitive channel protein [Halomonas sp. YLGW01]